MCLHVRVSLIRGPQSGHIIQHDVTYYGSGVLMMICLLKIHNSCTGSYNPEDRRGSKKTKQQAMDELAEVVSCPCC